MPRLLNRQAIREAQLENSSDVFLVLLTIVLEPEEPNVYLVNNTEDVVSRGTNFIGCPFSISLPDSTDRTINDASIAIDNVDPRIWRGARMLSKAPEMVLEVIMASDPDEVLMTSSGLKMREANATKAVIQGKLTVETVWQNGFPAHDYDPSQNPGIFGT